MAARDTGFDCVFRNISRPILDFKIDPYYTDGSADLHVQQDGGMVVSGCNACYAIWTSYPTTEIISQGCWLEGGQCDSTCTSRWLPGLPGGKNFEFCCCRGARCNVSPVSAVLATTTPTSLQQTTVGGMRSEVELTYLLLAILAGLCFAVFIVLWRLMKTCEEHQHKHGSARTISNSTISLLPAATQTAIELNNNYQQHRHHHHHPHPHHGKLCQHQQRLPHQHCQPPSCGLADVHRLKTQPTGKRTAGGVPAQGCDNTPTTEDSTGGGWWRRRRQWLPSDSAASFLSANLVFAQTGLVEGGSRTRKKRPLVWLDYSLLFGTRADSDSDNLIV